MLSQQTVQHRRRIGAPGMPPDLLEGQFAINDVGDGVTLARLYGGVALSALYPSGVATLVSNQRQVELTGEQTITGDKTIDVGKIHVLGGSHGDTLMTDGFGNLFWVAGNGAFPEAPTDGQVYGRDGLTESWVPVLPTSGGHITGDLYVDGNLEINGMPVVGDAPIDGNLYVRGNASWILLPWQWPDGGGGEGGNFPEAPPTGIIYGRNGQSQSWVPVLPLSGGTMLGTLILDGPPVPGGNPDQAATMGYVDSLITGALQFIGTMDASVTPNVVTYTTSSGLPSGPLVPANTVPDRYVIVTKAGVLNAPTYLAGQQVNPGDWLMSDGSAWNIIGIGGGAAGPVFASDVIVTPPVAGQDNVQSVLTTLLDQIGQNAFPEAPTDGQIYGRNGMAENWQTVLPLAGGTMLGNLILDGPPTLQSPPNQAATKGYVDGLIMGALEFLGTMDASTSEVTYTISSGITPNPGPLVQAAQAQDQYVIVAVPGTIDAGAPANAGGTTVQAGDWLISDGATWQVINVSAATVLASNVTVNPSVMGQTDVQGALDALASAVGQLQSQVAAFLTSVSTIGDVYSFGSANP